MVIPNLDFSETIPLVARINGKEWVTFQQSLENKMSGKEFKKQITKYAHKHRGTMVEVQELYTNDGYITVNKIKIL